MVNSPRFELVSTVRYCSVMCLVQYRILTKHSLPEFFLSNLVQQIPLAGPTSDCSYGSLLARCQPSRVIYSMLLINVYIMSLSWHNRGEEGAGESKPASLIASPPLFFMVSSLQPCLEMRNIGCVIPPILPASDSFGAPPSVLSSPTSLTPSSPILLVPHPPDSPT